MRRSRMPRCEEPRGDPRRNLSMRTSADVSTNSGRGYRYNLCCVSSVKAKPDSINISASGVHQCKLAMAV